MIEQVRVTHLPLFRANTECELLHILESLFSSQLKSRTPCLTVSLFHFHVLNEVHAECTIYSFVCAGTPTLQQLLKALKQLEN